MATTSTHTPSFSRLTEGRRANSWRSAIPAVVAIGLAIALLAYLASRVSSYGQQLAVAERDNVAAKQQADAAQKRADELNKSLLQARSAGRTTVVMQSEDKGKDAGKAWGTATLGEAAAGKSWLRFNAYGLAKPAEGKAYHAWMMPLSGEPVQVAGLEPAQDGSAFAMGTDLLGVEQGKKVMVSLDAADGAKAPEQVLFSADLPTLASTMTPAPAGAPAQ